MQLNLSGDNSGINRLTNDEIVFVMDRIPGDGVAYKLGSWLARNPSRINPILRRSRYHTGEYPRWAEIAKKEVVRRNPQAVELMGLFGWSWQEKMVSLMKKNMGDDAAKKKLSTWWGENTRLIDNLHREYTAILSTGKNPVSFADPPGPTGEGGVFSGETEVLISNLVSKTSVDRRIVEEFLRALFVLARDGKIDYKNFNPVGYKETKEAQKSVLKTDSVIDKISTSANTLLWVAGAGMAIYLLNTLKGLTK